MNKITKKHILVIVLLVVLGAGLVLGTIFGLKALQTQMNLKRVEVLATIDPEAALNELKETGVANDDLSAYLSVLVLTRQAMNEELSDAAAMDKISQLISSAETALELGVLSEEHTATVKTLLAAARGDGACDAEPYASLQKLLEYSTSMTGYSYRLQMGLEFSPDVLLSRLNALTQGYDELYTQLEGNLGEYTAAAKQLGEDCAALMALLTKDLADLSTENTFRFQFIPPEWTQLDEAAHVNHDALQEVLAEKVLPVFRARVAELGLAPAAE